MSPSSVEAPVIEQEVLARITPTREQQDRMAAIVAGLESRLAAALADTGLPGTPSVQGSVAKGTWLAGNTDLDAFLLMDPSVPDDRLKDLAGQVGDAVLSDTRQKYAQHPYVIGEFQGFQVDLVPAYRVDDAGAKMSAVDRTPFHTRWVRENLDEVGRGQVRLLKRWCKGVEVYGAETRIGGFSGYLLEVLVGKFGDFAAVLAWLADPDRPMRIALAGDAVEDDVSPLVVVDPVDASRNCAAAVQADVLRRAAEAAAAYRDGPDEAFFFPAPPAPGDAAALHAALSAQGSAWLGVVLAPRTDRLDLVFPQFQRAARTVADELERRGFPVHRSHVDAWDDDAAVGVQWIASALELPPTRLHTGPATTAQPNADKFRSKWDHHPDAAGPVHERDGHLVVDLNVPERTATAVLEAHLDRLLVGKHVRAAAKNACTLLTDPADAPAAWAPRVADVVLDRRPWCR